jgi:hypothetical protein
MPTDTSSNKWSKYILATKIVRYIFGLAILIFLFVGVPLLSHQSPVLIFMFTVSFPGALFVDPLLIAGLYFMFTGKFRPRIDITAFIIIIACIIAFISLIKNSGPACPQDYNPVCGTDEKTYQNRCVAESQNHITVAHEGECKNSTK